MNRFYIERPPLPSAFASYAPLPSLALLLAFGPPPHNTQYLGIGLFLLRSALWEQLSGSYLAFSASPTLPVAAGLAPAVLAEIASFANLSKALRSGLYLATMRGVLLLSSR